MTEANRQPADQGTAAPLRVLIADDHPLFRMGLALALRAEGHEVVAEAENGRQAVERARHAEVDVVLLDVRMPELDGISACRDITTGANPPTVVMLTTFDEPAVIQAARDAGASAYLSKETAPRELARMLRNILAAPERDWMPVVALPELTPREAQALAAMARGLSNKAIAAELGISPDTVKDYLENVYRKLDVRDRVSAVRR
ncbi:MAG TPA: response regulator transcription factor, partial [Trueperaceae bacterium]|nr:response regulator transcription factor [Trueperaceae bacterium]